MGRCRGPPRKKQRQASGETTHRSASKSSDPKHRLAKRKIVWESIEQKDTTSDPTHAYMAATSSSVPKHTGQSESQAFRILTRLSRGGVDNSSPCDSDHEDQKLCEELVADMGVGSVCEVAACNFLGAQCDANSVADFHLNAAELFQLILSDHHYLKTDSSTGLPLTPDSSDVSTDKQESPSDVTYDVGGLPDAESIQKFFLDTVNLISYKPMTDGDQTAGADADSADSDSTAPSDLSQTSEQLCDLNGDLDPCVTGSMDASETLTPAGEEEGQDDTAERRSVAERLQGTSLLSHATDLLLKMWESYLLLPSEVIHQRELAVAEELGVCQETWDLMRDKGRYIWQLLEECGPQNLQQLLDSFHQPLS